MNFCRSGDGFVITPERVLRNNPVVHYGEAPRAAASFNKVHDLIRKNIDGADLGVLGDEGVNVLTLNLDLDQIGGK